MLEKREQELLLEIERERQINAKLESENKVLREKLDYAENELEKIENEKFKQKAMNKLVLDHYYLNKNGEKIAKDNIISYFEDCYGLGEFQDFVKQYGYYETVKVVKEIYQDYLDRIREGNENE